MNGIKKYFSIAIICLLAACSGKEIGLLKTKTRFATTSPQSQRTLYLSLAEDIPTGFRINDPAERNSLFGGRSQIRVTNWRKSLSGALKKAMGAGFKEVVAVKKEEAGLVNLRVSEATLLSFSGSERVLQLRYRARLYRGDDLFIEVDDTLSPHLGRLNMKETLQSLVEQMALDIYAKIFDNKQTRAVLADIAR